VREKKTDLLLLLSATSRATKIPLSELIEKAIKEGILDENLNPIITVGADC